MWGLMGIWSLAKLRVASASSVYLDDKNTGKRMKMMVIIKLCTT